MCPIALGCNDPKKRVRCPNTVCVHKIEDCKKESSLGDCAAG